mgnify:CR=1 FL=1
MSFENIINGFSDFFAKLKEDKLKLQGGLETLELLSSKEETEEETEE